MGGCALLATMEKLRGQLQLIDEASAAATAQLEKRSVFHTAEWEIGLSVAASSGDQNANPFVSMVFHGTDAGGGIVSYPVTFTLFQFNEFTQNVQRMQKAISSF